MATWAYPPLPPDQLKKEEDASLARELDWLLESFQDSLASLKEGLEECIALLAPKEPGSTLVLSSLRSESVKGFVTRVGTKVVKGDINLRLTTLPPPRGLPSYKLSLSSLPTAPDLVLTQLTSVRNLINESLDVIDVSRWTGNGHDANFMSGQLRLLQDHLSAARLAIKGDREEVRGNWCESSADENTFEPPLPSNLSFHLFIADAALVLQLRTLQPISASHTPTSSFAPELSLSGFSLRDRLFGLGSKLPAHDEMGETFTWKGQEVKVREKVRVESQDPSLISVMAKLSALDHELRRRRAALNILMDGDAEDAAE